MISLPNFSMKMKKIIAFKKTTLGVGTNALETMIEYFV